MKIKTTVIVSQINSGFASAYGPHSWFVGSGVLWNDCINTIKDAKLMNHIIFCNDIMEIPPVKTFLMATTALTGPFNNRQKKAMGAFFGYVFKNVFHYRDQRDSVPVNTKSVKKAALFLSPEEPVEVTE